MAWARYTDTSVVAYDDLGNVVTTLPRSATDYEVAAAFKAIDQANQEPNCAGFQVELLQSAAFSAARIEARQILDSELPRAENVKRDQLLRASTVISDLGAVVLATASQQDPTLLIGAWLILRQADLVSPDVAAGMAQIATAYHLPSQLIRAFGDHHAHT
jgi:hypothetical protein